MTDWFKARLGRMRWSTVVLIVVFATLFWVNQTFQPERPPAPTPAVVPPGFVPDPNYTWVPRTNVQKPTESSESAETTTTTTPTSPTTTTNGPTTEPSSPTTTVIDPDGPGPEPPATQTLTPTTPSLPGLPPPTSPTPPTTVAPAN